MKRIENSYLKGFRLFNDDIRFMQTAYTECFEALLSSFDIDFDAGEIVILTGVNRTTASGVVSYTEGYVIWNHQICKVEATSFSAPTTGYMEVFILNNYVDPVGLKISDDGLTTNAGWVEPKMQIVVQPISSLYVGVKSCRRFNQVIKDSLPQSDWETFRSFTDTEFGTGTYQADISTGIDGITVLRGKMMFTDVGPGDIVATIPVGMKPLSNVVRVVSYFEDSTSTLHTIILKINTAGQISFTNTPTYSIVFDFGQVLGWKIN